MSGEFERVLLWAKLDVWHLVDEDGMMLCGLKAGWRAKVASAPPHGADRCDCCIAVERRLAEV